MPKDTAKALDSLPKLSAAELRSLWAETFGWPLDFRVQKDLLIKCLAYRLQEQTHGGLRAATVKRLQKLMREFAHNYRSPASIDSPRFKPGTRLIREWQGKTFEVTGERIRDKIAASKKKGMWMGGYVPLGYNVIERELVINETEAALIRDLYQRYLKIGCVRLLKAALDRNGVKSKTRIGRDGRAFGGAAFSRGALYTLLRNPLYVGKIRHRDAVYPGNQEAIMPRELWDEVQAQLDANRVDRRNGSHAGEISLLAGVLYDAQGQRMTPSHAVKRGKRYRYYVSQALIHHSSGQPMRIGRIPAHELEQRVLHRLGLFLDHSQEVVDALAVSSDDTTAQAALIAGATAQQVKLAMAAPTDVRQFLGAVVSRITIGENALAIAVTKSALRTRLLGGAEPSPSSSDHGRDEDTDASLLHLSVAFELRRFSGSTHLVVPDGVNPITAQPQVELIRALACARRWHEDLLSGQGKSQPRGWPRKWQ